MPINFGDVLQTLTNVVKAAQDGNADNLVIVRCAGLEARGPYEGNEDMTLDEFVDAYGQTAGIPQGVRPVYSRTGVGTVVGTERVQPGVYEATIDKKENA